MFVVICYLNAGRCIWASFCDVIYFIYVYLLLSQNNFNLMMMKWTFWFCWKLLLMDWSVLLINLCLFAIQNCFLTFIKVPVDRTWLMMLMDWRQKMCKKECLHFSRTMARHAWHEKSGLYYWLSATFFLLDFLIGHSKKLHPIYRNKDRRFAFGMGKDKKTWLS